MQKRYIAPVIMLTAGAITSVFNIIKEVDFYESMKSLFIVLIIFFIIGKIVTIIITKITKEEIIEKEEINEDNSIEEDQTFESTQDTGNK